MQCKIVLRNYRLLTEKQPSSELSDCNWLWSPCSRPAGYHAFLQPISHTATLLSRCDSKCALAIRESPCVDKLSEVMHKTHPYKLLPIALVSRFSLDQIDTISTAWHIVCRISGHREPLQLQVPLGTGTIWSLWLSTWHIPFYFWQIEVSGHASEHLGGKWSDLYGLWSAEGHDADVDTPPDMAFCKTDELQ